MCCSTTFADSATPYKLNHVGAHLSPALRGLMLVTRLCVEKSPCEKCRPQCICPNVPCHVTDKEDLCCLSSFPVASQTDVQTVRQTVHLGCRPHGAAAACKILPGHGNTSCSEFDESKAVAVAHQDDSSSLVPIIYIWFYLVLTGCREGTQNNKLKAKSPSHNEQCLNSRDLCVMLHIPRVWINCSCFMWQETGFSLDNVWLEVTELFESQKCCDSRMLNCSPYRHAVYEWAEKEPAECFCWGGNC